MRTTIEREGVAALIERMVRDVCPAAPEEARHLWSEQFGALLRELRLWSARFNITRIREPDQIVVRHFVDSLLALPLMPRAATRIIDVGCGAGFPGLPIKICRPELEVALLDSRAKAIAFVRHAAAVLGLEGVSLHHMRAEEAGRQLVSREVEGRGSAPREAGSLGGAFDCVVVKALARVEKVLDLCLPLVKEGGRLIAFLPARGLSEEEVGEIEAREMDFRLCEDKAEGFAWQRKFLVVEKRENP